MEVLLAAYIPCSTRGRLSCSRNRAASLQWVQNSQVVRVDLRSGTCDCGVHLWFVHHFTFTVACTLMVGEHLGTPSAFLRMLVEAQKTMGQFFADSCHTRCSLLYCHLPPNGHFAAFHFICLHMENTGLAASSPGGGTSCSLYSL